jgi:predicted transcriptional regulator
MQEASEELANLSNQKISALLTQLVKNGKVARVEDKRKALFKVIG